MTFRHTAISFLLDVCSPVEFHGRSIFSFQKVLRFFYIMTALIDSLPTVCTVSICSVSSPVLLIIWLFPVSHPKVWDDRSPWLTSTFP